MFTRTLLPLILAVVLLWPGGCAPGRPIFDLGRLPADNAWNSPSGVRLIDGLGFRTIPETTFIVANDTTIEIKICYVDGRILVCRRQPPGGDERFVVNSHPRISHTIALKISAADGSSGTRFLPAQLSRDGIEARPVVVDWLPMLRDPYEYARQQHRRW